MTGKPKYSVLKAERVIGDAPREFTRVKILLRQEVLRNEGGGTRWATNKSAEPIVVNGVELNEELETMLSKALEAWYAARVAGR